ncbi:two-component system histidine kinase PnpS [Paenibacillus chartarius]|uniref:histidine kinase n=1 Tax=Paenibacillus chartarius TaxID=747481 RepID=A0ABV6DNA3_9BACL
MNQFRAKLTFIMMVIIGLSMLTAGLFIAKVLEDSHVDLLRSNLMRELKVISVSGDWGKSTASTDESISHYTEQATELKNLAYTRITYIGSDGQVLGDSDQDPRLMDNHFDREEIAGARANGFGSSIRYSDTLKQNMLYVAMRLDQPGQQNGYLRLAMSLKDVEATVEKVWYFLIVGLAVLFVLAGAVSYRIARGLTRPIEKITRVAKQITNMNYKARVNMSRNDEVGQLGRAINAMADSLQLQMHRITENENRLKSVLENMTSGVMMIDKDERIVLLNPAAEDLLGFTAQELLGKKYDEAKQQYEFAKLIQECVDTGEHVRDEMMFYYPSERILDINLSPIAHEGDEWAGVLIVLHDITAVRRLERMRSEFVANVSHELKTPIAAVKGFTETLLAGALNDMDTAKQFLQIIFDESERLNRLIGDILELSKIESKRIPLQFSPVDMPVFVDNLISMMRPEANKKHIELLSQVPDDMYMEADEDRLRQIFINLLSNGINYTPEGGKVKVRIDPLYGEGGKYSTAGELGEPAEYERVRITIQDTGIGIPKKDLPRIFERFYRVDKARSRSSGGTGLGLSIVKHLVELHHGTIRVDSEPGFGTTFTIELPVIH